MIGPNREKRPGHTIANALHIARFETRAPAEVNLDESKRPRHQNGGRIRADAMTQEQRRQTAKDAVDAAWGDRKP